MKVAFDTSPLTSAHQGRGVGTYTRELIEAIKKLDSSDEFIFSDHPNGIPADLIHYPYFDLFFLTLPAKPKTPFVVTIHDVIPLVYPHQFPPGLKGKFKFYLQKMRLHKARAIITDSVASQVDIHHYLKIPQSQIHVVPLGANPIFAKADGQEIVNLKRKYHLPDHFLGYVGDVNYNKNIPRLIKAIGQTKATLIIVTRAKLDHIPHEAQTQMTVNAIKNALSHLADPNQVKFISLHTTSDLINFYSACDFYIQPSLREGFGLPVLEALSCGTPVLSSETSSLPEIAGKAALYFKPDRIDSIITAINKALTLSPSARQKLIDLGKIQARRFSWAQTARQTLRIYQQALTT